MEKLHELEREFDQRSLTISVVGLEGHVSATDHFLASRHRGLASIRRLTLITEPSVEQEIARRLIPLGASGYTATTCRGMGKHDLRCEEAITTERVRIEIIATGQAMDKILGYLAEAILPHHYATACLETVDVLRTEQFLPVQMECSQQLAEVAK
jgi:hypothetical protein